MSRKHAPGLSIIAAAVAGILSFSGCANPPLEVANTSPRDVGTPVKVSEVDSIAAMVPEEYRKRGTFTVSINPDVAPVKFVNGDGEIKGLSPDIINSAAKVMGLKADIQKGNFDAMVPGLESKRFDVIASIGDFKERQEKIDFIDYLMTGTSMLASADFPRDKMTPDDLCGLTVGYARGTTQQGQIERASEKCKDRGEKKIEPVGYGDGSAGVLAVKSKQDDIFWGDGPIIEFNAATSPEIYKSVFEEISLPYGIGVHKDNSQFRDALRAALLHLEKTGYYKQALEQWGQERSIMKGFPLNDGPSSADL
ncbi:ABC transporter substrate-binding protein [Brevibacterium sp. 50QC2O2]|uniref:ABC transporter substrate-binding protein n=1 Tax=Brevibacterium sp. 50QC2O2 TaxID=2968459 RepID=UPI00211BE44B|nr:ABC transporter substrate-binding protein [Brevibacterium sp. 50QC2O2]MCQ9389880.1 ABC transporter substrate-binding protein [Brevibacterium sp. 50QC2O2]